MEIDTNGVLIGDYVVDQITGFEGIVVGITQWTTGCARASVQPVMPAKVKASGGKLPDSFAFDVLTLDVVKFGSRHDVGPAPESIGAGKGGPPTRSVRDR